MHLGWEPTFENQPRLNFDFTITAVRRDEVYWQQFIGHANIRTMSQEALQLKIKQLEQERDTVFNELQTASLELQRAPDAVNQAYANGYTKRKQEDFVKDEDLKNRVAKGMEDIMLELRMQGCSNHVRSFGRESSEKFQGWLQNIKRNLALVGHDDARARAHKLSQVQQPISRR